MNEPKTFLEPLVGLVLDEVMKLRNEPFTPHSLTKLRNIRTCKRLTAATTVVEIGTFKGITTKRLAKFFEHVISVEIDLALHTSAKQRLRTCKNVELILGDGTLVLPEISDRVSRAILYLDGHFSGGLTGMGDEPEPVLSELDLIADHLENFVGIVIDDFRLFGEECGWPSKSEVFRKVEEVLPSLFWSHRVMNDQIICIKKSCAL